MAKVYIVIIYPDSATGAFRVDGFRGMIGYSLVSSQLVSPQDSLAFIDLKYISPNSMRTTWRDLIGAIGGEPLYLFLDESLGPAQQYDIMRSFEQVAINTPFNPKLNIATTWRAEVLHNSFLIGTAGISTLISQRQFTETMRGAVEGGLQSLV